MLIPSILLVLGLLLLLWSSDRFVEGASSTAKFFGMPSLLIGMVIVGFGTSAPELVVSTFAAIQGNPGIALGNAYGSNIANIALILGLTAIITPVRIHSAILRKELPILTFITGISILLLMDLYLSFWNALYLLVLFAFLMTWSVIQGMRKNTDSLGRQTEHEMKKDVILSKAIWKLLSGLVILIGSSRVLVWAAVEIAHHFGVSDTIIGLTVVAVGTSLPELASSIVAARKGEPDIAIGNIIGSNLFNTLAVVGISGVIHPTAVESTTVYRDMTLMALLTISLFVIGYGFNGRKGRINRFEGAFLVCIYLLYTSYLIKTIVTP
ncbi:calcium/sodium antiporter [Sphaerochaeta sp. PS]|uniref:calcium/sodium antiporter n=1 Tax=Sphaerochaeta sp. PS TaxID=3076336 RepID=UPI0028A4B4D0|nr:calcium/sodium antiporter [Sphaerochaeta sp. PS]MDT4761502.1 calcium/sodium antiporter [Sphaerochaeta sp. PS]